MNDDTYASFLNVCAYQKKYMLIPFKTEIVIYCITWVNDIARI